MAAAVPSTLACLLLLSASAFVGARAEETSVKDLEAGVSPGAFALNDQEGKAVRLGSGEGHGWYVLAFYPKASTGG